MFTHLAFEVVAQLALAQNHEARVGHLADHQMRGLHEMPLPLVRDERGDVADDRRLMRKPERLVHVHRRRRDDVLDVDPFVDGDGLCGRHAVGHEHLADGVRGGDEAVDLPVLPARERVAFEMKIDAARRDQRGRAAVFGG